MINLYRTETIFDPIESQDSYKTQNLSEYSQILGDQGYTGSINQIQFSNLMKETLGSVTDHGAVNLYNVNTK